MPGTDSHNPHSVISIQQGRAAEYQALEILRKRGYLVIRAASQDSLVHLMACRERERPLFVRIKRTRKPAEDAADVVGRWVGEIDPLRVLLTLNGSVQFWVHSNLQGWQFYEVHPGGIAEVRD